MTRTGIVSVVLTLFSLAPGITYAHAFGQQYTLPLPFALYATGAVIALIISFAILGLYVAPDPKRTGSRFQISIPIRSAWLERALRIVGVVVLILTIIFAFFGSSDFTLNPTPILFWVVLMLGMTYVSMFIGGLWRFLNPFESLVWLSFFGRIPNPLFRYPSWAGYWPALILYYFLICLELLSGGLGALPVVLGTVLLWYLFISFAGVVLFGSADWFTYCDFFSVFFRFIGRFAPLQLERGSVKVELPGESLVSERETRISALFFLLFMLSSTAFDGLQDTQVWSNVFYRNGSQPGLYAVEEYVLLFLSPFVFFFLYAGAVYAMKLLTRSSHRFSYLLLRFAYSLIPIAIAYNFAHYFTFFVGEVPALIAIASDPFAKGWNLFNTAASQIPTALIGAQVVWYTQFGVILGGHMFATYIAHRVSVREFNTRTQIVLGQLPMLALMVLYTVFGLWILSQALA